MVLSWMKFEFQSKKSVSNSKRVKMEKWLLYPEIWKIFWTMTKFPFFIKAGPFFKVLDGTILLNSVPCDVKRLHESNNSFQWIYTIFFWLFSFFTLEYYLLHSISVDKKYRCELNGFLFSFYLHFNVAWQLCVALSRHISALRELH